MKSVSLQNFEIPDDDSVLIDKKKYSVYLYWERKKNFTNRKKLLNFLSGSSKELTYSMTELVSISKELFLMASDAFIYIEDWNGKEIESFNTVFVNLNRVCSSHGPNSHIFIFKAFYDSIISLNNICNKLNSLYRKKNQFLQVRQIEIMLNRIEGIKNRIDRIG